MITLPAILCILPLLTAFYLGYLLGMGRRQLPARVPPQPDTLEVAHLGELGEKLEARRREVSISTVQADRLLHKAPDTALSIERNKVRYNSFLLPIQYARLLGYDRILIHLKPNLTDDNKPERGPGGRLLGSESSGGSGTASHHP